MVHTYTQIHTRAPHTNTPTKITLLMVVVTVVAIGNIKARGRGEEDGITKMGKTAAQWTYQEKQRVNSVSFFYAIN